MAVFCCCLCSMAIGAAVSDTSYKKIEPFFETIFMGALCIFLCDMGMEAGKRLSEFKQVGVFLVGFGIVMPSDRCDFRAPGRSLLLGYSVGGVTLVTVLAASCSYIAVPPAMRLAIPEANPSFYLTLSLGVYLSFQCRDRYPYLLRRCSVSGGTGIENTDCCGYLGMIH